MNTINNSDIVKRQYENAANLNTRISIHDKYSVNKLGFGNWIFSNYEIKKGMRILELGCGTGDMWKEHLGRLEEVEELVLTDFSSGMLASAREKLGENKHISYNVVDAQSIPYEDNSFDIVIANMMLYHVPDIRKGLSEIRRVLKTDGTFYCATYGEHGIMEYVSGLLQEYHVESKLNKNFTLQNGKEILNHQFNHVVRLNYEDALEVTDIGDLIDYIYSLTSMSNIGTMERSKIEDVLKSHMVNGILFVPKEYGMFVCRDIH